MSDANAPTEAVLSTAPSTSDIDFLLTAQLVVAWAGESGTNDDPSSKRLGWWRTSLVGDGAEYELKELLPNTWQWVMFQSVREAARLHDAFVCLKDHDPDRLLTLYSLGFAIDEKVEDRLRQLKLPVAQEPGLTSERLKPTAKKKDLDKQKRIQASPLFTVDLQPG